MLKFCRAQVYILQGVNNKGADQNVQVPLLLHATMSGLLVMRPIYL